MCRMFSQNGQSSIFCDFKLSDEEQHCPFSSHDCNDDDDVEHLESMLMKFVEDEVNNSSTDASNQSHVAALDERRPTLNNTNFHDYVELNDICDPDSASSSSNNFRIIDEYFNSEELLKYLVNTNSQNIQEEHKDHKLFLSTSAKPTNVVLKAAQPAGLIACIKNI